MDRFSEVIDAFDSAEALAGEIGEKGVTVRAWRMRNSIPPRYWPAIEAAARRNGIGAVTIGALAQIAVAASQHREAS